MGVGSLGVEEIFGSWDSQVGVGVGAWEARKLPGSALPLPTLTPTWTSILLNSPLPTTPNSYKGGDLGSKELGVGSGNDKKEWKS